MSMAGSFIMISPAGLSCFQGENLQVKEYTRSIRVLYIGVGRDMGLILKAPIFTISEQKNSFPDPA